MKNKFVKILMTVILAFAFSPVANALGVNVSLSSSGASFRPGTSFTIYVNLSGVTAAGGIASYGPVSVGFDSSKVTYQSASIIGKSSSDFGANVVGSEVRLSYADGAGGSGGYTSDTATASINFIVNSNASAGTASFTLSGVGFSNNDSAAVTPSFSGKSVTILPPLSTNNNLSSLTVSSGSLAFNASTTSYDVYVAGSVSSINIGATAADSKSSVTGVGLKSLVYGKNICGVVVTAENGAKRTYTVNVYRADDRSTNNYLSNIIVSSGSLSFNKNTLTYYVNVAGNVTSFNLSATKESSKAVFFISPSATIPLRYGNNVMSIKVTAENGAQKIYTVYINRLDDRSTNNYLKVLSIDNLIDFKKDTLSYTATVENSNSTIQINGSAEDSKATVTGLGTKDLVVGSNVFQIPVTAENGVIRTYTITVIRKDANGTSLSLSNNNNLKSLTIAGYNIDFRKDVLTYVIGVSNNITDVEVKAEVEDTKANYSITGGESLQVGDNKILINTTAEDGTSKIYTIFVTRKDIIITVSNEKDAIIAAIKDSANKIIVVEIKDTDPDKIISKEVLKVLKGKDKIVIFNIINNSNGILYSAKINGMDINNTDVDLNLNVSFKASSEEAIESLSTNEDALYLSFKDHGDLPAKEHIKLFVGNKYKDAKSLLLYYYNPDKNRIEFIEDNIVVKNGYVEFDLTHHSDYFLTQSLVESASGNPGSSIMPIIVITAMIVVIIALLIVALKSKKSKKIAY